MEKLIYLVDDDSNLRRSLQLAVKEANFNIKVFHDSLSVLKEVKDHEPDLLVLDMKIDQLSGLDIYKKLIADSFNIPAIFISGHSTLANAVEGVKLGAFDFLEKPFAPEKLIHTIRNCFEFNNMKKENEILKLNSIQENFKGESKVFLNVLYDIQKVANLNSTVLVTGESGTGKELIAKEIHKQSSFSKGPFIKVNCSAIPESLFESEFFGHVKGAFTGADRNKKGYFELAHTGTIFLDEIGEMSLINQAKLLRVLQNQEIQKLGSESIVPVKFRVVCATNKDLRKEVANGNFREDLFYRINVFPIHSPALRERKSDIPLLAYYFLSQYLRVNSLPMKQLSEATLKRLIDYSWPGNIRELKNAIERAAILGGQVIDVKFVEFLIDDIGREPQQQQNIPLKEYKMLMERDYILKSLKKYEGNISLAAQSLQIERTYLHKKIQDFDIHKKEYLI